MSVDQFQTLDITRVRQALTKLHEDVACGHRRVEIKRKGTDDLCVMISKCELEALEQALEILASCGEYKSMCDEVTQVVAAAGPVVVSTQACSG